MHDRVSAHKAAHDAAPTTRQDAASAQGAALTPPAYGIAVIDQMPGEATPAHSQSYQASARGSLIQRQAGASVSSSSAAAPPANTTGLPDTLKAGIENLSSLALDDVRVHYNSAQPARLHALAYTQGAEIHVAPGQERHLPHEAWHVVQQKQGRVQPTMQAQGVAINDDKRLEREADTMGASARFGSHRHQAGTGKPAPYTSDRTRLNTVPLRAHGPTQRMKGEDLRFLQREHFGLRHLSTLAQAEQEQRQGTPDQGGDAVPLNAFSQITDLLVLLSSNPPSQDVIDSFVAKVETFIGLALARTINIEIGKTTPHQLVASAFQQSTFLLVKGMSGTDTPGDIYKQVYAGLGKAGKQKIRPEQIVSLATFDETDAEFMELMYSESWDTPILDFPTGEAIYRDLVFLFSDKIQEAVTSLRTGKPPAWQQERINDYSVPPDFDPDSPEVQALLAELDEEDTSSAYVIQKKQPARSAMPVVQMMYEDAKYHIADLLEEIRSDNFNNETDAERIVQQSSLDLVTKEEILRVKTAVEVEAEAEWESEATTDQPTSTNFKNQLASALAQSHAAFADKLLEIIKALTSGDKTEIATDETLAFIEAAQQAVNLYLPTIMERIEEVKAAAESRKKPLLVIVGERHDDPYAKLIEAVLIGKLKLEKLFIEATAEDVEKSIAPFKKRKPTASETTIFGHRQHFYHYLYQHVNTVEGVDVDKDEAKQSLAKKMQAAASDEERATFIEQSLELRNRGILKTLQATPASGVLIVGVSHLPGLVADSKLAEAYQIVAITTLHPNAAIERDRIMYGRKLSTTSKLEEMEKLVIAGEEDPGDFNPANVNVSQLIELAQTLIKVELKNEQ